MRKVRFLTLFIMIFFGFCFLSFQTNVNAAESKITIEEARQNYVNNLRYGYNVTGGTAIYDDGLNIAYPILKEIDQGLYTYITKNDSNTKSEAGNYISNSALSIAEQSGSLVSGGINAKIAMVNADISTTFNKSSGSTITYSERYENFFQEIHRVSYVIEGHVDLREYLDENFKKELYAVDDVPGAKALLEKYGTHLFTGFKYGGLMQITNYIKVSETEHNVNNVTSLSSKVSAAMGAYGGGTSFSFAETYINDEIANYGTSNYKVILHGGLSKAGVTIDHLFQFIQSAIDGKGHYAYDDWVQTINDGTSLAIVGSPKSAKQIPLWELLPSNKYSLAKTYLIQAYAEMCGDKYSEFLEKYPSTPRTQIGDEESEGLAQILGHTIKINDNVTYYDHSKTSETFSVSRNAEINMNLNTDIPTKQLEWKIVDGISHVEILDNSVGIFKVKDTAASGAKFTIALYKEEEILESMIFSVKNSAFSGGDGTETHPYIISTNNDIEKLSTDSTYWGKDLYFKLVNNIDLNGEEFIGIGTSTNKFEGNFDGNNYSISNFKITSSRDGAMGFFAYNAGNIKNLKFSNVTLGKGTEQNINLTSYVGGLVGYNSGTIQNCIIDGLSINCKIKTNEAAENITDFSIGGLVGLSVKKGEKFSEIIECAVVNAEAIRGKFYRVNDKSVTINVNVGGLVGETKGCIIKNSYINNINNIEAYSEGQKPHSYSGGLVGKASDYLELSTIIVGNLKNIIADFNDTNWVGNNDKKIGAVIGLKSDNTTAVDSYSTKIMDSENKEIALGMESTGFKHDKLENLSFALDAKIWNKKSGKCPTLLKQENAKMAITADYSNAKTEYYYGEEFNIAGITVQGSYVDIDETFDVPYFSYDSQKFNKYALGTYTIYINSLGLETYYQVKVKKINIVSLMVVPLTVTPTGEKVEFVAGEEANSSCFEVYYVLENGDILNIKDPKKDYINYNSIENENLIFEKCELVYGVNNIIFRQGKFVGTCVVNAKEKTAKSLEIYKDAGSRKYKENDIFGADGMEFKVTYEDNTTKIVSYKEIEVIGNKLAAGENNVVFAYGPYVTCELKVNAESSEYTVTFKNSDGSIISSKNYNSGDTVEIPENPEKPSDNTYEYKFIGWDKEVSKICNGTVEYIAQFEKNYINYKIVFKNWDGTILSEKTYHYGDTIVIPNNPTRPSEGTTQYSFTGWDKTVETKCTQNAVYMATYNNETVEQLYTVVFKNWDGTIISSKTYKYGETVVVPSDPTRPSDNYHNYEFVGWDKAISVLCVGNAEYIALYEYASSADLYTVVFKNWDGTIISSKTYKYGETIVVPSNPTRPSDGSYNYEFIGWDKAVSGLCIGNAEYTATYNRVAVEQEYTVVFKNWDGTIISSKTYKFGEKIVVPSNPTRPGDGSYNYEFIGWDKAVNELCIGNAEYTAEYRESQAYFMPGDVNGDGVVNGKDVTLIRRYNAGYSGIVINLSAADVNNDGVVNGKDVTLIRRHNAGYSGIVLLPSTKLQNKDLIINNSILKINNIKKTQSLLLFLVKIFSFL